MSWFSRVKDWAEEVLTADDLNAEFDNVAAALNGLFAEDRIVSSEALTVTGIKDVPGTTKELKLTRPSIVHVTAVFDFDMTAGAGAGKAYMAGYLSVDGSSQTDTADIGCGQNLRIQGCPSQTFRIKLGAGNHTLKLRAEINTDGPPAGGTCWKATYMYLVIPDPEP